MARLFQFLLKLASEKFYGEVRLRFRDGKPVKISTETDYLDESLPQPDAKNPEYQKVLRETVSGVELTT